MPIEISRSDARRLLIAHLALERPAGRGASGTRKLLQRLRCIQLDPLDVIGTNADLVVMARVEGVARGDVWKHLFPGHAFEHFAKERCLLPAEVFPWYRRQGHKAQTPWWRHDERQARVDENVVAAVLAEVTARGPVTARELTDHGAVRPMDWSGWTGTTKATTMALELLWTQCDVVVAGRTGSGAKLYDIPQRAIAAPHATAKVSGRFEPWALLERVTAAGLLSRASGAQWSMLSDVRTSEVPEAMLRDGKLVEVTIEGSSRPYLALPSFLRRRRTAYDDCIRILGPLDPLLWDRKLVQHIFDFDYIWEVYKPAPTRIWGWYVCPLLHRERLIGRLEARAEQTTFVVKKIWIETGYEKALEQALRRHAALCGCSTLRMPRR